MVVGLERWRGDLPGGERPPQCVHTHRDARTPCARLRHLVILGLCRDGGASDEPLGPEMPAAPHTNTDMRGHTRVCTAMHT